MFTALADSFSWRLHDGCGAGVAVARGSSPALQGWHGSRLILMCFSHQDGD
jgi:hypothetical protein